MTASPDDITLVTIERKLRQLVNDLALSQHMLAEARDTEVAAKHIWEGKRRRLLLNPDCPQVGRAVDAVTVDQRNAWVDTRCEEEQHTFELAEVRRKAAEEHLRTLRDQSVLVATLAKSVQVSMGLAGHSEPQWSR